MSFKGSEKHIFLGGNTPDGFYSYYDYMLKPERARKVYCIKGGPGTGKSTFMKKIAEAAVKKGADVELAHCSSDPDSLDGVIIKPANIAFVDGTPPHVVEPRYPGAVEEIINLGMCWDENSIRPHKEAIMKTNGKISECFGRAYRYLAAAKCFQDDIEFIYRKSFRGNYHSILEEDILYREFAETPVSDVKGDERNLFVSAVTPKGIVNYAESLLEGYKTYVIKGYAGTFLKKINDMAVKRGFDTEKYFCPFAPGERIDHLLVPKLNLAFTVSNEYHTYEKGETVDFDEYCSRYILEKYRSEREFAKEEFDRITDKAISAIAVAKQYHDELEKYYIPSMDFAKTAEIYEKTIKEVLEFI